MAAPVKAITYLTGVYTQVAPVLPPRPLNLLPRAAITVRQAPPLWKPVRMGKPQTLARTVIIPRALYLQALVAMRMSPYWRSNPDDIPKGQQYP